MSVRISYEKIIDTLKDFWEKKCGFNNISADLKNYALLTSPYFPNTFTPSIGAGILDFKISNILANSSWDTDFNEELFYVYGVNFRAFDIGSVPYSNDRLSLFHSMACFHIKNPNIETNVHEKIIKDTYNFLVDILGLSPKEIVVSIFSGGHIGGVDFGSDKESLRVWNEIGLEENNIIKSSTRLNYLMSMVEQYGNPGLLPFLGPRSEIFYRIKSESGLKLIEIATMQYILGLRDKDNINKIIKMPTVYSVAFGVERLSMIMNGFNNIFEIDILDPLMKRVYSAIEPNIQGSKTNVKEIIKPEAQVLADHIRAYIFLILHINKSGGKIALSDGKKSTINKLKKEIKQACQKLNINPHKIVIEIINVVNEVYISFRPEMKDMNISELIEGF